LPVRLRAASWGKLKELLLKKGTYSMLKKKNGSATVRCALNPGRHVANGGLAERKQEEERKKERKKPGPSSYMTEACHPSIIILILTLS
jgi:hypothetical protein